MPRFFMTYDDVMTELMLAGLRQREARRCLVKGKEMIPPHPHDMHSHRRWLPSVVVTYCEGLKQNQSAYASKRCLCHSGTTYCQWLTRQESAA